MKFNPGQLVRIVRTVVLSQTVLCGTFFQLSGQPESGSQSFSNDFGTIAALNSLKFEEEINRKKIKEAIGDHRVVLLGEQSHGDGTTFTAKVNLIKFLHQELEFDVIAFESDLFALDLVNKEFQKGGNLFRLVDDNVYPIWTNLLEMDPLYHYMTEVKESRRSMAIAGFDCRHSLYNSRMYMLREITGYLKGLLYEVDTKEFVKFSSILANLNSKEYLTSYSLEEESFFFAELKKIQQFVGRKESSTARFYQNLFRSIEGFAKNAWSVGFSDGKASLQDKYGNKDGNVRDFYLAQNAMYLINEQYKGRKIIFWGATYHFTKNLRLTDSLEAKYSYRKTVTMGDVLSSSGVRFYSMGFTANKGFFGLPWTEKPTPILPASIGSFEDWATGKGMQFCFLSLNTRAKFLMRPMGHNEMMANWSDILNGVIFIEEMHPVTPKH